MGTADITVTTARNATLHIRRSSPLRVFIAIQRMRSSPFMAVPIVLVSRADKEAGGLVDRFHCVLHWAFAPASDAVASVPPSPMVSTADDGTITIEPRSLIASYSMFMARRCSATGFSL